LLYFAEHFLDLVNSDFSDEAQVDRILDTWEESRPDANTSSHHRIKGFKGDNDEDGQMGVTENKRAPIQKEIPIMFRRQIKLIIRDRTYNLLRNSITYYTGCRGVKMLTFRLFLLIKK
jgi:hypothetical protein